MFESYFKSRKASNKKHNRKECFGKHDNNTLSFNLKWNITDSLLWIQEHNNHFIFFRNLMIV